MRSEDWRPIESAPVAVEVETKIDDEHGERNVQPLVARQVGTRAHRVMWWFPDGSMYVYYTPTHWRPLPESPALKGTNDDH